MAGPIVSHLAIWMVVAVTLSYAAPHALRAKWTRNAAAVQQRAVTAHLRTDPLVTPHVQTDVPPSEDVDKVIKIIRVQVFTSPPVTSPPSDPFRNQNEPITITSLVTSAPSMHTSGPDVKDTPSSSDVPPSSVFHGTTLSSTTFQPSDSTFPDTIADTISPSPGSFKNIDDSTSRPPQARHSFTTPGDRTTLPTTRTPCTKCNSSSSTTVTPSTEVIAESTSAMPDIFSSNTTFRKLAPQVEDNSTTSILSETPLGDSPFMSQPHGAKKKDTLQLDSAQLQARNNVLTTLRPPSQHSHIPSSTLTSFNNPSVSTTPLETTTLDDSSTDRTDSTNFAPSSTTTSEEIFSETSSPAVTFPDTTPRGTKGPITPSAVPSSFTSSSSATANSHSTIPSSNSPSTTTSFLTETTTSSVAFVTASTTPSSTPSLTPTNNNPQVTTAQSFPTEFPPSNTPPSEVSPEKTITTNVSIFNKQPTDTTPSVESTSSEAPSTDFAPSFSVSSSATRLNVSSDVNSSDTLSTLSSSNTESSSTPIPNTTPDDTSEPSLLDGNENSIDKKNPDISNVGHSHLPSNESNSEIVTKVDSASNSRELWTNDDITTPKATLAPGDGQDLTEQREPNLELRRRKKSNDPGDFTEKVEFVTSEDIEEKTTIQDKVLPEDVTRELTTTDLVTSVDDIETEGFVGSSDDGQEHGAHAFTKSTMEVRSSTTEALKNSKVNVTDQKTLIVQPSLPVAKSRQGVKVSSIPSFGQKTPAQVSNSSDAQEPLIDSQQFPRKDSSTANKDITKPKVPVNENKFELPTKVTESLTLKNDNTVSKETTPLTSRRPNFQEKKETTPSIQAKPTVPKTTLKPKHDGRSPVDTIASFPVDASTERSAETFLSFSTGVHAVENTSESLDDEVVVSTESAATADLPSNERKDDNKEIVSRSGGKLDLSAAIKLLKDTIAFNNQAFTERTISPTTVSADEFFNNQKKQPTEGKPQSIDIMLQDTPNNPPSSKTDDRKNSRNPVETSSKQNKDLEDVSVPPQFNVTLPRNVGASKVTGPELQLEPGKESTEDEARKPRPQEETFSSPLDFDYGDYPPLYLEYIYYYDDYEDPHAANAKQNSSTEKTTTSIPTESRGDVKQWETTSHDKQPLEENVTRITATPTSQHTSDFTDSGADGKILQNDSPQESLFAEEEISPPEPENDKNVSETFTEDQSTKLSETELSNKNVASEESPATSPVNNEEPESIEVLDLSKEEKTSTPKLTSLQPTTVEEKQFTDFVQDGEETHEGHFSEENSSEDTSVSKGLDEVEPTEKPQSSTTIEDKEESDPLTDDFSAISEGSQTTQDTGDFRGPASSSTGLPTEDTSHHLNIPVTDSDREGRRVPDTVNTKIRFDNSFQDSFQPPEKVSLPPSSNLPPQILPEVKNSVDVTPVSSLEDSAKDAGEKEHPQADEDFRLRHERYISGNNTDIVAAAQFLHYHDKASSRQCSRLVQARWNYATNLTEENRNKQLEQNLVYASFKKQAWKNATSFAWTSFDDPLIHRWFKSLSILGDEALPENKLNEINTILTQMKSIYHTAKICPYRSPSASRAEMIKCTVPLDPDVARIMTLSRDYSELLHVWKEWRDVTGRRVKERYRRMVELSNEAARLNGFMDTGDLWRETYETPTFQNQLEKVWQQLLPLYQHLHAFVRRRLIEHYGSGIIRRDGPIPAHLLGNLWGQYWSGLVDLVLPYPDSLPVDVTPNIESKNMTTLDLFKTADHFFTSLGLESMPPEFWKYSIMEKPNDRNIMCRATAWDFCNGKDFRITHCTDITMDDLVTVHHEMGHVQYFMQYARQPNVFRDGANPGFHEAIADTIAMSVSSPQHLQRLGLLNEVEESSETSINTLLLSALDKVVFMPFSYIMDLWRWKAFSNEYHYDDWNTKWWELRLKYQGLCPPVRRTEHDFDPGAKYHILANTPYIRYFVSYVIQFQFHKALCTAAGHKGPLHKCDIYESKMAGEILSEVMELGNSQSWSEIMKIMTNGQTDEMDGQPLLEYFEPLIRWLEEENRNETLGWRSDDPTVCP